MNPGGIVQNSRHTNLSSQNLRVIALRVTPPRLRRVDWDSPSAALDYELAQERAAAFGRLGRALEAALTALRAFDEARASSGAREVGGTERDALVADAGIALWNFVVQREASGLRDARTVMRDYRVPAEVQARMGAFPPRRSENAKT